jgi:hypothetical protein
MPVIDQNPVVPFPIETQTASGTHEENAMRSTWG